jgi:hypothetical protein
MIVVHCSTSRFFVITWKKILKPYNCMLGLFLLLASSCRMLHLLFFFCIFHISYSLCCLICYLLCYFSTPIDDYGTNDVYCLSILGVGSFYSVVALYFFPLPYSLLEFFLHHHRVFQDVPCELFSFLLPATSFRHFLLPPIPLRPGCPSPRKRFDARVQ